MRKGSTYANETGGRIALGHPAAIARPNRDPVHAPRIHRPVNVVVIGTTGDPAAPYKWSAQIAGQIPGAVLVTNVGTTHTAFGIGRCQAIENEYFITGFRPARGATCPATPPEL
jgi:hypothetical protein